MSTAPEDRAAIAAAIILHDGKLLLAQRKVKEGSLSWQFPAGEVEPGESVEQAAVRETGEEVGLTVHATKLLGEGVHPQHRPSHGLRPMRDRLRRGACHRFR